MTDIGADGYNEARPVIFFAHSFVQTSSSPDGKTHGKPSSSNAPEFGSSVCARFLGLLQFQSH